MNSSIHNYLWGVVTKAPMREGSGGASTMGLVEFRTGSLTPRGKKYLEMLNAVPLPIEKPIETEWVDPRECGE